jgi:hypothetical protein
MIRLHLLVIGTGLEAHALRSVAEYWGADVTVTWVGNSGQIVAYLSQSPPHDVIVLSGHGDEHGLLLPGLVEEIRSHYPYHSVIRPEDFADFLHLKGNTVINTSCLGGMPSLAKVFLERGASFYIGPIDYPEGNATLMYILEFLYSYLRNNQCVEDAHLKASSHDDDRKQFALYQSPNREQFSHKRE